MKTASVFLAAALFLLAADPSASAQGACSWSSGAGGADSLVRALAVFDDGTGTALFAGGEFTVVGGVPANRIARWDGNYWSPLWSGANSSVSAMTVFDDGTGLALYAGGSFTVIGGVAANRIARRTGLVWSSLGSGVDSTVSALAVFDDGTGPAIYAGGTFTAAGAMAALHVARWDGTSWSPLGSGVSSSAASVSALAVFDGGTGPALYVGGTFTSAGGVVVNNIARWDGSTWSPLGSGVTGTVRSLKVYDDGAGPALYVGGTFTSAGGVFASNLASWDGAAWSSVPGGVSGNTNRVSDLTVYDDGGGPALYAGGDFSFAGGAFASSIARWDGTSFTSVGGGVANGGGSTPGVQAMTVFDDGTGTRLFAGGSFTSAGGMPVNHIASWGCGGGISLAAAQASPGSPLFLSNSNLTPGNRYYNVFSFDLCPGGAGAGPPGLLGLCATNVQPLLSQLLAPLGTPLIHFLAPASYVNWGPFSLGPITADAVCFEFSGGTLGAVSPVIRITVQ
ncbi:MAG: hypothetical protein CMJ83_11860 [Planctomycetes bacterium]|nr:hypothetical protein [Planctomycetota bacterium]